MKILLVQSCLGDFPFKCFPLGLAYLAAVLVDHEVQILDLNVIDDPYRELPLRIREFAPEVIGISLRNIDDQSRLDFRYFYRDHFQKEVEIIRQAAPDTPLVVGGSGFSLFARDVMVENPQIDFGIYLEGEESFPELLRNLDEPDKVRGLFHRRRGEVHFTGTRPMVNFQGLPTPDRDLLKRHSYDDVEGVGIQTTRGCPLRCVYCVYPKLGGKVLRSRPAADVVDEIERLVTEQGLDNFFFADSVFGGDLEQAQQICRLIIERGLKVRWGAHFDVHYADPDFYRLASRAGCVHFFLSPDGYSDQALQGLHKRLTTRMVDDNLAHFLGDPDLSRTTVIYTLFLNAPGETLAGLLLTLWFWGVNQVRLQLKRRGTVAINWIRIEPETGLHQLAMEQGDVRDGQTLLPPAGEPVEGIFYKHPRLRALDKFLLAGLRIYNLSKRLAKPVLKPFLH